MLRLELGLPADLVELADAVTTQLTWPQWLQLRAAGLGPIAAAHEAAPATLTQLLNDDKAAATLQKGLRDRPLRHEVLRFTSPATEK
jgi:hypothetical protein